jgi:hypothetical protein
LEIDAIHAASCSSLLLSTEGTRAMDSKALDSKAMDSRADEYRARAVEYEHKAKTLGHGNAAIAAYYQSLAKHWRSLALLNENKTEREHTGQDAGR